MNAPALPLAGLRIVSVEQYGAGPFASMYLADMGAEVIKIEPPGAGDVSRQTGPFFLGPDENPQADSQFFQTFNLNKRSLSLDLKHPQGRAVFEKLVQSADAVMNNLRGDQPAKLKLDYAHLRAIKPAIVCAHLSAYGRGGSRESWPGYDYLMQAEAGFMSLTGEVDAPPARFGLSMVDYMTGMTLAFALLASLIGAKKTGMGRDVDVALFDVALHQLSYPATWYLNAQHLTTRLPRSAHPATVPCQICKTADGWIFVMAMLEKFWQTLCKGLQREHWLSDPRFVDFAARRAHRDVLSVLLDDAFSAQSNAAWMQRFAGEIPIAPVYDIQQALDNPYLAEIAMLQSLPHGSTQLSDGELRALVNPIRLDGARVPARTCPPIGADNLAVLQALGYSDSEISALREARAI
jgi:crotonobetainyl-CoA:carnitine CoA-transferase CaiB-like acyl-CoA transferase